MSEPRVSQKIGESVYAKVAEHAEDYGYAAGEFIDLLLEFATLEIERVDQAVDERRKRGTEKGRNRRMATSPVPLRAVSPSEPERQL